MPATGNTMARGVEKTIDNGRFDRVKRVWVCTAAQVVCSCQRHQNSRLPLCSHSYKNRGELLSHHKSHHGSDTGTTLECRYGCGHEAFQNKSNQRRHEQTCQLAPKSNKALCPACHAEQARSDNFRRHLTTKHGYSDEAARRAVQVAMSQTKGSAASPVEQLLESAPGVVEAQNVQVEYPPLPDLNLDVSEMYGLLWEEQAMNPSVFDSGVGIVPEQWNNLYNSHTGINGGTVAPGDLWVGAGEQTFTGMLENGVSPFHGCVPAQPHGYTAADPTGYNAQGWEATEPNGTQLSLGDASQYLYEATDDDFSRYISYPATEA